MNPTESLTAADEDEMLRAQLVVLARAFDAARYPRDLSALAGRMVEVVRRLRVLSGERARLHVVVG